MRIIISPAKKMKTEDTLPSKTEPVFLKEAEEISSFLKGLGYEGLKKLWGVSDKLMGENWERLLGSDLHSPGSPALLSYDGIQYTYMAPSSFEDRMFSYLKDHLRILSGLYGVLRPFDRIVPYRLEMQAKAKVAGTKDLYAYWGSRLYEEVMDEDRILVNLASEEYAKAILPYGKEGDRVITPVFYELVDGKPTTKGVYAKMARGEFVAFMADKEIKDIEGLKSFSSRGYSYNPDLSTETTFCFTRN